MNGLTERQAEFAAAFNLTYEQYMQVVKSCTSTEVVAVLELAKSYPKSSFRKQMADRLKRWLELGTVSKPFSEREFKALTPTYPIRWKIPT